ncbi:uncharacterized protein LOC122870627 isoform X1 [Siniperca chuatsi]|uniref:uncharacterized protein LOC122870627 isoform X1 n=1 Tax=Siniperca chuatsi TaxID=119488 RepID=UPI001CE1832C|nr:uncharacterized protein LOC122870627 isoform X1 [Siniperca chuatsi]
MAAVSDEAAAAEEGTSLAQSPLVTVTFQRDVHRKQKYLEAEPKALGITQIGLSVFQITCESVFMAKDLRYKTGISFFISSLLVILAGSVAIAAQNLHLPTLRACLGMEIVACGASIFNIICTLLNMDRLPSYCHNYFYDNATLHYGETCYLIESTQSHFYAEYMVIQVTLLAISGTLATYCCKVTNCCSPAPKMPVVTVQARPVQQ